MACLVVDFEQSSLSSVRRFNVSQLLSQLLSLISPDVAVGPANARLMSVGAMGSSVRTD